MSSTVDANILVYASNESEPIHAAAKALVEQLAAGPELVYLFWPVLLGYLRVVTHPAILPRPLGPRDAITNIDSLVRRPHIRTPGETEGFWELFRATGEDRPRGNDTPDVHLATLMRQNGVHTVYSRDRGLRRFPGITVVDPFAV